jgi:hypothetical protein
MECEIKYIGTCDCLDNWGIDVKSARCTKRYYKVFDPQIGYTYKIAFCNDYLKLHIQEKFANQLFYESRWCEMQIESLIVRALNLQAHHYYLNRLHPVIHNVSIKLCERPSTYIQVSFKTCIQWYLHNRSFELWEMMTMPLNDFIREKKRYKKYKGLCEKLQQMVRQVPKKYHEDLEPLINDILLLILKIIYNETNKQQVPSALPVRPNGKTRQARSNSGRSKGTSTLSEASQQCSEV